MRPWLIFADAGPAGGFGGLLAEPAPAASRNRLVPAGSAWERTGNRSGPGERTVPGRGGDHGISGFYITAGDTTFTRCLRKTPVPRPWRSC